MMMNTDVDRLRMLNLASAKAPRELHHEEMGSGDQYRTAGRIARSVCRSARRKDQSRPWPTLSFARIYGQGMEVSLAQGVAARRRRVGRTGDRRLYQVRRRSGILRHRPRLTRGVARLLYCMPAPWYATRLSRL